MLLMHLYGQAIQPENKWRVNENDWTFESKKKIEWKNQCCLSCVTQKG